MISTVPQGPYVNTNKQAFERAKIPELSRTTNRGISAIDTAVDSNLQESRNT